MHAQPPEGVHLVHANTMHDGADGKRTTVVLCGDLDACMYVNVEVVDIG